MLPRLVIAAEIVLAEPGAWLVSAAGFLARGGVVLFMAAMLQLPSPITLTLIFGVDSVTAAGEPTARLIVTIALLIGAGAIAVVAMLLTAAWADAVSIRRVQGYRSDVAHAGSSAAEGTRAPRRAWTDAVADVLGLSWLQSLGLLPGAIAVALVAPMLREVAVGEVLLPSSFSVPYLVRVFAGVAAPLGRALLVLLVAELVVTIATRRYLEAPGDRSTPRAYGGAAAEIIRRPGAVAVAWVIGAGVLLVSGLLALWAVSLAWNEVRGFFLDLSLALPPQPPGCGDAASCGGPLPVAIAGVPLDAALGAIVGALLFAVVWIAALALIGIASAFRSTLWTLTIRSRVPEPLGVGWRADAHP